MVLAQRQSVQMRKVGLFSDSSFSTDAQTHRRTDGLGSKEHVKTGRVVSEPCDARGALYDGALRKAGGRGQGEGRR